MCSKKIDESGKIAPSGDTARVQMCNKAFLKLQGVYKKNYMSLIYKGVSMTSLPMQSMDYIGWSMVLSILYSSSEKHWFL